jgi:uncharacterized protein (TIGR00255 family)
MIQSMTGFGRAATQVAGKSLTVEIRSVNSRYLEIHVRLPREYQELELVAKKKLKESLLRGRVDVSVSLESTGEEAVAVNEAVLESYLSLCRRLSERHGLRQEPDITQLLRLPRVVENTDSEMPVLEELQVSFESTLEKAFAAMKDFRTREGTNLAAEMVQRLKCLQGHVAMIRGISDRLPSLCRDRLAERLKQLLPDGFAAAEERILLEAAVFADKSDIREELERLGSHIAQFQDLIQAGGDAGRRLDFLLQEMNREANTILSKADLLEVSRVGVEMKAEIERLREQVQNIE